MCGGDQVAKDRVALLSQNFAESFSRVVEWSNKWRSIVSQMWKTKMPTSWRTGTHTLSALCGALIVSSFFLHHHHHYAQIVVHPLFRLSHCTFVSRVPPLSFGKPYYYTTSKLEPLRLVATVNSSGIADFHVVRVIRTNYR